jgi:hypothetical protein
LQQIVIGCITDERAPESGGDPTMTELKELTRLIEEAVDKGATTVEEIHREIADLPLTVLERVGLFERTAGDVRSLQEASIGAVYDVIRDVNHQVTKLAGELLEGRPEKPSGKP